jgi:hypothetical protein
MRLLLVALLIIAILAACKWWCKKTEGFLGSSTTSEIPKHIWTYWDNPDTVPKSVKMCMESWKKHNPDYEIHLITKQNYAEFADIPSTISNHPNMNDSHQRFSDLVRLYVLAKHGGVWCDSSILVGEPFSKWLVPGKDLNGFSIKYGGYDRPHPIIESWFFICPKESPFVRAWRDEFAKLCDYNSVKSYVDSRREMGVDVENWSATPEYLAIHVSAQKILQIDKYPLNKLAIFPSEDGPFKYLVKHNWDGLKGLTAACSDMSYRKPFMKLRGSERQSLESNLTTLSNEKCKWV